MIIFYLYIRWVFNVYWGVLHVLLINSIKYFYVVRLDAFMYGGLILVSKTYPEIIWKGFCCMEQYIVTYTLENY